jgi:tRNA (guanine-N7-)-methyltransferase
MTRDSRPSASPHVTADEALRLPLHQPIQPRDLFAGRAGPLELEVGSARGGFLFERQRVCPEALLVGLEVKRNAVSFTARRIAALGLGARVRVFAEDARTALPRLASASFRRVYLHFPDPWWKKRHAKRRLSSSQVLQAIGDVLEPGGELFIQTDVAEHALAFENAIQSVACFGPPPSGARLASNPHLATSPRERQATKDGLPIYRLSYLKLPALSVPLRASEQS